MLAFYQTFCNDSIFGAYRISGLKKARICCKCNAHSFASPETGRKGVFADMPGKCPVCQKSVYAAEERKAVGKMKPRINILGEVPTRRMAFSAILL